MVRIENVRETVSTDSAAIAAVVDLQVSTTSDLPAKGSMIGSTAIMEGSIAQVVRTGGFYTLDSNGTWYDESGNAAS